MKKWYLFILIIVLVPVIYLSIVHKVYYPSLPFSSVSKSEVLQQFERSSDEIMKVTDENGYEWYISKTDQAMAGERMKDLIREEGWSFETQEGSGYFFKKEKETLLVVSQMWTGDYVLFKMKSGWKDE